MPDIFLYTGEANPSDVRLRDPSIPASITATASLAWIEADDAAAISATLANGIALTWTEADDVTAITVTAGSSVNDVTLAWTEETDTASITVNVATPVTVALAWTEDDDSCAIAVTAGTVEQRLGGGAIYPPEWYGKDRRADPELREKLRELFQGTPEPVREAIEAQSISPFESFEAEERRLREATEAAQLEYQALYLRLLAYQREEMLMEEEAIVMTMFAVLSR